MEPESINKKIELRAHIPDGINNILNKRNLSNANRRLKELIRSGMRILDIGCGSGSITADIALTLNGNCEVIGLDINPKLIEEAKNNYSNIKGLIFICSNIELMNPIEKFDIVTAARVLQWIPDYRDFLSKMFQLVKPGGILHILDYNHHKIEWVPKVPESMAVFYQAFLDWRKDAGMNNKIADYLERDFQTLGLHHIRVIDQTEYSERGFVSFLSDLELWSDVAKFRGPQIVKDGFVGEFIRVKAIQDYNDWMNNIAISQKLYLKSIEGIK
jgi:ubiquinone/menaquinone biosynthesis C-methylase UbiE